MADVHRPDILRILAVLMMLPLGIASVALLGSPEPWLALGPLWILVVLLLLRRQPTWSIDENGRRTRKPAPSLFERAE